MTAQHRNTTTERNAMRTTTYNEGDRVEFAPHLDIWMRGARYGTVLRTRPTSVEVLPDNGPVQYVFPEDITLVRKADVNKPRTLDHWVRELGALDRIEAAANDPHTSAADLASVVYNELAQLPGRKAPR